MNNSEVVQLTIFSALAMHALIHRATVPTNSRDVAVRAVEIAEDLMVQIASARDQADEVKDEI